MADSPYTNAFVMGMCSRAVDDDPALAGFELESWRIDQHHPMAGMDTIVIQGKDGRTIHVPVWRTLEAVSTDG